MKQQYVANESNRNYIRGWIWIYKHIQQIYTQWKRNYWGYQLFIHVDTVSKLVWTSSNLVCYSTLKGTWHVEINRLVSAMLLQSKLKVYPPVNYPEV